MNFYKKNKYVNEVNSTRLDYFTSKFSSKKIRTFFSRGFFKANGIKLIITDPLLWVDLFPLLLVAMIGSLKSITIIAFEMYHIDVFALKSERQNYKKFYKKSLFRFLKFQIGGLLKVINLSCKLMVLKFISNLSNLSVVVHSELRKKYLERRPIGKNSTISYYRHFPMASLKKPNLRSENFMLLAGRINNLVDFEKVINFSVLNHIQIYVVGSGAEELNNSCLTLPSNLKLLGPLPHEEVLSYAEKCLAGIVLYENTSVNQNLSASTKLFEFLYYGKPVICSMNLGLIEELRSANVCFCSIDQLSGLTSSYFSKGALNKINHDFTFESEMIRYFSAS